MGPDSVYCKQLRVLFVVVRFGVDKLATPAICSLFQWADSDMCPGYKIRHLLEAGEENRGTMAKERRRT